VKENYPKAKKVLVFGEKNIADELRQVGFNVWHYTNTNLVTDMKELVTMVDKNVDVVVFGYDFHFDYTRLCLATFHVQHGAKLVGTNPDKYTMQYGYKVPGCGSLLSSV
jgi:ribonucleotide monophosphatase NagD (HAD superfamily)